MDSPHEQFEAAQLEGIAAALEQAGLLETQGMLLEACQMPVQAISAYQRSGMCSVHR